MTPSAEPDGSADPHSPDPRYPDPRYPVGDFVKPAAHSPESIAQSIETIRLLPQRLREAVDGLDDSQLDTPYRDGGWTVRQLVHHVADSHANAYVRIKLALTEDWPTIKPYEEAIWAELPDSKLPIAVSLDILTALHSRWAFLLDSLTEEQLQRGYVHPAGGRQGLPQVLALYAWHSRHHTAHLTSLRSRMGW
jgi:uncharacterized damage-inducible protein DinB